jgi:tetraacyldisaccharide 4'-kinase
VAEVGDEALMAAVRNPRLPVTVGPDKARSCLEAARMGAGVIILDDGFHRLDIPRALDLVVFDAARGVGNGACLPRGPLREPVSSLSRADLVVVFTSPGDAIPADLAALCREHCPAVPLLAGEKRPGAFLRWAGQGLGDPVDLAGRTVSAFCGLGNPGSFRRSLADAGGSVSRFEAFPDHHTYRPAELARLGRAGCEAGAAAVVTTLKDAVKIPHWPDEAPPLAVLTVDAVIADPDGQLGRRLDLVAGVGR